jgi:hypothetical protein
MRAILAAATIVTSMATAARAEPLDAREIPADAQWLVHIDITAAKTGRLFQAVGDLWLKRPLAEFRLQQFQAATGMDPSRDLHRLTLYGRSYEEDAAVMIVRAKLDRQRLERFVSRRPDFRRGQHGQHQLLSWTEKKGQRDEHAMTGCFFGPEVLVFGRNPEEVKNALEVLAGRSPHLTASSALHAPVTPAGTVIEVRGVGLADVKLPFESPLVRKSKYLIAAGGESNRETFAEARVTTESPEVARQLRAVLEGLVAMARLRFDADNEILTFLDAVNVSMNENTVEVQCRWPSDQVAKLLEEAWKMQRNRK